MSCQWYGSRRLSESWESSVRGFLENNDKLDKRYWSVYPKIGKGTFRGASIFTDSIVCFCGLTIKLHPTAPRINKKGKRIDNITMRMAF